MSSLNHKTSAAFFFFFSHKPPILVTLLSDDEPGCVLANILERTLPT